MSCQVALIGFGEAAQAFAQGAGWSASAFDRDHAAPRGAALRAAAGALGVRLCPALSDALADAACVLSLVTPDQAEAAALAAAPHLGPDTLFLDANSATPAAKRRAAAAVERAGARYVDVAILAPVLPERRAVALLVSGPHAAAGAGQLASLGFTQVRIAGAAVGDAAAIKLLRSIVIKGAEALVAESLTAAHRLGLVGPLMVALPGDWSAQASRALERMLVHGQRRAAEMEGVAAMLADLGLNAAMSRAAARWQARLGLPAGTPVPEDAEARLALAALRVANDTAAGAKT